MAYSIIRHRRGTTDEWKGNNIIPYNGEIVIEECVDGSRKCKIGDGINRWLALPYIDDACIKLLSDKIEELNNKITKELTKIQDNQDEKLVDELRELSQDFTASITQIVSDYQKADEDILLKAENIITEGLKTNETSSTLALSKAVDKLEALLDSLGRDLSAKLDTQIAELKDSTEANLKASEDVLNNKITDVQTELKASVVQAKKELIDEIAIVENKTTKLNTELEVDVWPSITKLEEKFGSEIKRVDTKHSEDVEAIDTKLADIAVKIDTNAETIQALNQTVQQNAQEAIKNLTDESKKLNTKIDEASTQIYKVLDDSIAEQLETHNQDIVKTVEQILTIEANLKQQLETISTTASDNLSSEVQTLVDKIDSDIESTKTLLAESIMSSEQKQNEILEDALKVLEDKIAENDVNIKVDIATLKSEVELADSALSNALTELKQYYENLVTALQTGLTTLSTDIKDLKAADIAFDEKLTDQQELLDNLKIELDALRDELIALIEQKYSDIQTTVSSITDEISALKTGLAQAITDFNDAIELEITNRDNADIVLYKDYIEKFNGTLNEFSTFRSIINQSVLAQQDRIAVLATSLEEHQKANDEAILKVNQQITEKTTSLGKRIDTNLNLIGNLNARIDYTNEEVRAQAARISNIVKLESGSTTGDAELMDIRNGYNGLEHATAGDAVRAIGNDLDDLKASLPDYIPSNAVDGLLYENNLLYLTSDGMPVSDPVEITGGSGGGGGSVSIVRVKDNLGSTNISVAKSNQVHIDFTYTSFENDVPTAGDGTLVITINNKKIDAISGSITHGVAKRIEISEYLKTGSNSVRVTCSDSYGATRSLVYNINIIELRVESTFDSSVIYNSSIMFRYKVYGQVEKYIHILLDDVEISTRKLSASVSGSEATLTIDKQPHGSHVITAYLTATIDDKTITSNILEYEIICISDNDKEALIASTFQTTEVTQGDLISIPYIVYDPSVDRSDIKLTVSSRVAGEDLVYSTTELTVNRTQQLWNTRSYPVGTAIFTISYDYSLFGITTTVSKSHIVNVKALEVNVEAETDGLELFLSSQNRSNNEATPNTWTFLSDISGSSLVTTSFTNFNWKTNGWINDSLGDTCLRLNGDARATINFMPFATDFKPTGKTIEFEFAVNDVNDRDAIIIDCMDTEGRGFKATPDTAILQSSGPKVSCRYKDNERIRVSITVEASNTLSRFVSIYVDGYLAGVQTYATTDRFAQDQPVSITLGSNACGLDLYTVRVYNKALTVSQMLSNYIADRSEPTSKLKLVTDNDILDSNGNISYDRVKELGQIPIITFTGQMPTYKGDKKKKSVQMKFEDPLHPELNFDVLLDQIDVQGTSSQYYARKNWKVKLPEPRQHIVGAIPAKVFCIKVDYAEATGTHNTGTANYAETFYDKMVVTLPPQRDDSRVRTTIQGFPVILFEKATEDSEPVFSSKGNFNYDKDAEDTFGFTEKYNAYGVECWEFCNNTSDSVNFLGPIQSNWIDDFEPRYVPESYQFERIEELLDAKKDGKISEVELTELTDLQARCISNFKEMHDWVLSTATYKIVDGAKVAIESSPLAEPVTYGATTFTEDNATYRLAKFKNEFTKYFNMHYSSIYYVFTLFALMTDQRAKNLFLTRWKDSDGAYRWYPYFYDNDTIFGINNEGALVFDYYHEDTDQLGSSNVYNGQNSILWNNFRECFQKEIKETYAELRSSGKLTYDKIIKYYVTDGSDKWSAAIYNADAEYKYLSMARQTGEDGKVDTSNLYQVKGPGEHHLKYFIDNRFNYCDSMMNAGNYPSDYIFLRIYTPTTISIDESWTPEKKAEAEATNAKITASLKAVPASAKISLEPFSAIYAGVAYGANSTPIQKKMMPGGTYDFDAPTLEDGSVMTFNDTETAIYGASSLASLGNLAGLYCGVISLGSASKLQKIQLGSAHEDYYNDNFREISVGANRLLKHIDLRNCSGLGLHDQKTLDLSNCPNVEEILTEGTNLESISLPDSGYIKQLHLPASVNNINIKNQQYINDFSVASYDKVRTLCIENCPTIDTNAILNNCQKDGKFTVERVRLTGINWGDAEHPVELSFIKSLFPVYDDRGILVSGIRGIDERNNDLDEAYLVGTCYIESLTGEDYSEIKSHYPFLDIKFGRLTSTITFNAVDAEGKTHIYTEEIISENSVLANCVDPVERNLIITPYKAQTPEFDYVWVGWTRKTDEVLQPDALEKVAENRVLYPAFEAVRRSYKVTYINPSVYGNKILQEVYTLYGEDSEYSGPAFGKLDVSSPEMFMHNGWLPSPENITGDRTCYAQFTVVDDDSIWHVLSASDISDCYDHSGNPTDGYSLSGDTISILKCENDLNRAIKIPEEILITGKDYEVISVKGFSYNTVLELIWLPDTLVTIAENAFDGCYNLNEANIPEKVETIGRSAFQNCSKLLQIKIPKNVSMIGDAAFSDCKSLVAITVDEDNKNFVVIDNCLININTGALIKGLTTGVIPLDGTIKTLKPYCFSSTGVIRAHLPEGLTEIPNNAFSRCEELIDISIPESVRSINATAFAWCYKLANVTLPEGVQDIYTYTFNDTAIEDLVLPSTINNILERAFGDIDTLTTVTFKGRQKEDGSNFIPYIHEGAFVNTSNVTFNLPWTKAEEDELDATKYFKAPWGSKNAKVIYGDGDGEEVIYNDV